MLLLVQLLLQVYKNAKSSFKRNKMYIKNNIGSEKAFAAGADIKEMAGRTYVDCYINNMFENWMSIGKISKPVSNIFTAL